MELGYRTMYLFLQVMKVGSGVFFRWLGGMGRVFKLGCVMVLLWCGVS